MYLFIYYITSCLTTKTKHTLQECHWYFSYPFFSHCSFVLCTFLTSRSHLMPQGRNIPVTSFLLQLQQTRLSERLLRCHRPLCFCLHKKNMRTKGVPSSASKHTRPSARRRELNLTAAAASGNGQEESQRIRFIDFPRPSGTGCVTGH